MSNRLHTNYWNYALVMALCIAFIAGGVTYKNEKDKVKIVVIENLKLNHSLSISSITGDLEALAVESILIAANENIVEYTKSNLSTNTRALVEDDFDQWAKNCVDHFGFYDMVLISPEGAVFYTVAKENDLGTNLNTGAYRESSLGDVFHRTLESKAFEAADFSIYEPSNGTLAAFLGVPILSDGELIGVLAIQLPTSFEELNIGVHIEGIQDYIITSGYIFQHQGEFESLDSTTFNIPDESSVFVQNDSLFLFTSFNLRNLKWGILSVAPPPVFSTIMSWNMIGYHMVLALLVALIVSVLTINRLNRRIQVINYSDEDIILVQNTWSKFMQHDHSFGTDFYYRIKNKLQIKLGEKEDEIENLGERIEQEVNELIKGLTNEQDLTVALNKYSILCKEHDYTTRKLMKVPTLFIESLEDELQREIPLRAKTALNKVLKSLALQIVRNMKKK